MWDGGGGPCLGFLCLGLCQPLGSVSRLGKSEHGGGTPLLESPAQSDTYLLPRSHGPGPAGGGGGWEGVFLALRQEQHTRCGRPALNGSGLQGPARSPAHCRLSPSHLRMSPTRSGSVGVAKILKFLHRHLPVIFLHCLDLTSRLYSAPKGS